MQGHGETLQLHGDLQPWNCRVVFRLSGTGVSGATLRVYLERYAGPNDRDGDRNQLSLGLDEHPRKVLAALANAAKDLAQIKEYTGLEEPTSIT